MLAADKRDRLFRNSDRVLAVLALTSASTDYFAVQLDHPVVLDVLEHQALTSSASPGATTPRPWCAWTRSTPRARRSWSLGSATASSWLT